MRLERPVPAEALAALRAPFAAANATPVDAPVLQPLSLLLDLAGEAMRPRLFVVQAEGGEEAALRPDFTIPLARAHIEHGDQAGRYFYEGKAFRAAGGTTRAEEFLQLGVEAYGDPDPVAADAEIVALSWQSAVAGGRDDLTLRLGDAGLFGNFVDGMALEADLATRLKRAFARPRLLAAELDGEPTAPTAASGRLSLLLAGLPEDEASQALEELWALAGIEPVGSRPAAEIARRLAARNGVSGATRLTGDEANRVRAFLAIEGAPRAALDAVGRLASGPPLTLALERWQRRLEAMAAAGAPVESASFSAAFGRAFGYYDGPLFEVRSAALGEERPVAAGGRYDGLLTRLGGRAVGAVGCMVRPARAFSGGAE